MAALTKDRNTPEKSGDFLVLPVEANTVIYAGSLVALNAAGNVVPGSTATGLKVAGRAEEYVNNNPGTAGEKTVKILRGIFRYANSGTDSVTAANLLEDCYIVDDQTVARTHGTNTRSKAGKVLGVDSDGVWVDTRL